MGVHFQTRALPGSSWIPRYRAILLTAAIASLLTLINLLWVPSSISAWIVRCNWFIAVVVIWVTAILCMRRVQEEHGLCVAHASIEQQIEARMEEWRIEFQQLHYQEGM
ncbi:MAG: hypothetical protein L0Z46_01725 [Nitrospiraceae bacterium]|nr:hypothetical protein [Nitrospiraceae bacterium]